MPKYQVELSDGRKFVVEADQQPSEQDVMAHLAQQPTVPPSSSPPPAPSAPPAPEDFATKARRLLAESQPAEQQRQQEGRDLITGAAKSIPGAIGGIAKLMKPVPVVGAPIAAAGDRLQAFSEPTNDAQRAGKTVGNVAQFFVPGAMLTKAKTALATGSGILDALVGAGLEGATAGAVQSAQQGSREGALNTAFLTAGTTVGAQTAFKGLGWLSERVERALVKPSIADVKNGFQVSNVFRYKLGGSLSESFDKSEAKLKELSGQLQAVLKTPGPGGRVPQVDVLGAIADAAADLQQGAAKNFGQNQAINNAVEKLLNDPFFQTVGKTGSADLVVANQVKQAVGDLGAWLHDPSGRVMVDPDSKAMETVANAVYGKLKAAIQQQAQGPVAAINRQIGDIIPIRQAIIRRIPVDQRGNVLNLGDLMAYSSGAYGLALANRLVRSGQFANLANRAGEAGPAVAAGTARTAGGVNAQRGTLGSQ